MLGLYRKTIHQRLLRQTSIVHSSAAFESDGVDVLVLDLCDGIMNSWDELNAP